MILFGSSLSPFARKVLVFGAEKGIEIEVRSTGRGNPDPEFLAASPFRKMPALSDGDFKLADSSAIVHYLEAKQPDPALIPADARERGQVVWFDEFADTILGECMRKMFFNRLVAPVFLRKDGDLTAADTAEREELPPVLDYLEKVVPDAGGYIVGDSFSLADIAVASPFVNFMHLDYAIDATRHGRVSTYVASILSRPSFRRWVDEEVEMLSKVRG